MLKGSEEIERLIDEMLDDEPPENTKTIRKSKSDKKVEQPATKRQIDQLWKAIENLKDLLQNPSCQINAKKDCIEIEIERLVMINKQISKNNKTNNPLKTKEKNTQK